MKTCRFRAGSLHRANQPRQTSFAAFDTTLRRKFISYFDMYMTMYMVIYEIIFRLDDARRDAAQRASMYRVVASSSGSYCMGSAALDLGMVTGRQLCQCTKSFFDP